MLNQEEEWKLAKAWEIFAPEGGFDAAQHHYDHSYSICIDMHDASQHKCIALVFGETEEEAANRAEFIVGLARASSPPTPDNQDSIRGESALLEQKTQKKASSGAVFSTPPLSNERVEVCPKPGCGETLPHLYEENCNGSELWRVGSKVPINVYEGDRPICQCQTAVDAKTIVQAVNLARASSPPTSTPSNPFSAEACRRKIYELWVKAKKDFGQSSWQGFVRELLIEEFEAAARRLWEEGIEKAAMRAQSWRGGRGDALGIARSIRDMKYEGVSPKETEKL